MYEYWNCEQFQQQHPDNYERKGDNYIKLLKTNVENIYQNFLQEIIVNSYPSLTILKMESNQVGAFKIANSAETLLKFIEQFIHLDGTTVKANENFTNEEQKEAAQLFIILLKCAALTRNDWEKFRQQELSNYAFEKKQIQQKYNISPCCECNCQLI